MGLLSNYTTDFRNTISGRYVAGGAQVVGGGAKIK